MWNTLIIGLVGTLTITPPIPPLSEWTGRAVPVPAHAPSGEPNLTTGADGRIYLSWIEEGETAKLRFSVWEGEKWGGARTIAEGKDWFVNWADFPSLAVLEDGTLAAHWLQRTSPKTYSYGVRVALSRDRGRTWSEPITPHRDGTHTEHGFVSLVPAAPDRFGVFWLDGREMEGHGHGEKPKQNASPTSGHMTFRYCWLEADGKLGPEVLLDERVCECCQTSAIRGPGGRIIAVYRDASADETRDIGIAFVADHELESKRRLHPDGWKIAGCPVNGPAIDGRGSRIAVAWFTDPEDKAGKVLVATSTDGGTHFGEPVRIDGGRPLGRVDTVILPDGSLVVSWLEETDRAAEIRLRRVSPAGEAAPAVVVRGTRRSRDSGFPRLACDARRLLLVWTEAEEPSRIRSVVYEWSADAAGR